MKMERIKVRKIARETLLFIQKFNKQHFLIGDDDYLQFYNKSEFRKKTEWEKRGKFSAHRTRRRK